MTGVPKFGSRIAPHSPFASKLSKLQSGFRSPLPGGQPQEREQVVVPRAGRLDRERLHRVDVLRDVRADAQHVAAERPFDGGPAVSEQVVRGAHPRGDVVVVRGTVDGVDGERVREPALGVGLLRDVAVQVVPAHAQVERQAVDRPLVLREHRELVRPLVRQARRGVLVDPERDARRDEVVRQVVVDVHVEVRLAQPEMRVADLQVVRPGDVRHGRPAAEVRVRLLPVEAWRRVADHLGVVDEEERGEGAHPDVVRPHRGLQLGRGPRLQHRRAGLEQQPVGDRHRPGRLRQVHRVEGVERRRVLVDEAVLRPEVAEATALVAAREVELVPLARLPGQPQAVVPLVDVEVHRLLVVGRVDRAVRRQVDEAAGLVRLRAPPAVRRVEPEPVAHDRAAHADAVVPDLADPVDLALQHAPAPQLLVPVQALHVLVRAAHVHVVAELVAALLRDGVDSHAAGPRLGVHGGNGHHRLLNGRLVREVQPRGARPGADAVREVEAVPLDVAVGVVAAVDLDVSPGVADAAAHVVPAAQDSRRSRPGSARRSPSRSCRSGARRSARA